MKTVKQNNMRFIYGLHPTLVPIWGSIAKIKEQGWAGGGCPFIAAKISKGAEFAKRLISSSSPKISNYTQKRHFCPGTIWNPVSNVKLLDCFPPWMYNRRVSPVLLNKQKNRCRGHLSFGLQLMNVRLAKLLLHQAINLPYCRRPRSVSVFRASYPNLG